MGIAPMRILYVYGMAETKDIPITLRKMGYKVEEYPKVQENSILNDEETEAIVAYVKRHRITRHRHGPYIGEPGKLCLKSVNWNRAIL